MESEYTGSDYIPKKTLPAQKMLLDACNDFEPKKLAYLVKKEISNKGTHESKYKNLLNERKNQNSTDT